MKGEINLKNKPMTQTVIKPIDLAQKIDHTLLKPTLSVDELKKLCEEAAHYKFKTVCIPPTWVKKCVELLKGSGVGTITVVGFPLGYSQSRSKALESELAIEEGASEIDMVLNLSFLKNGLISEMEADVATVVKACGKIPLKVIIETAYLTTTEKIMAAKAAENAGATFVKTSTGFATGVPITGATLADIELLRKNLKPGTKIKASGGVRDLTTAIEMILAGADRLGTSSGVQILNGIKTDGDY